MPPKGYKHSEESKKKMSESAKKRCESNEYKKKFLERMNTEKTKKKRIKARIKWYKEIGLSDESRKKMSESHKTLWKNPPWNEKERRRKLSEFGKTRKHPWLSEYNKKRKGVFKHSEESKKKMSESRKGKPKSEEHKRKMSIAVKGNKNPSKRPEVRKKISKWRRDNIDKISGSNHPFWNPNREEVFAPYIEKFHSSVFRETILKEQKYFCPICKGDLKKNICFHHIDYDKQNDYRKNIVALHRNCHSKTNGNREYWKEVL